MPTPAIGIRPRATPDPGSGVDWSHPLCPTMAWIPSMGWQTIHGDRLTTVGALTSIQYPSPMFNGWGHKPTTLSHQLGMVNRLTGTLNTITMVVGLNYAGAHAGGIRGSLFTRNSGVNVTGISVSNDATKWASHWNSDSATYSSTSGPLVATTDEMVAVVFTGTTIEWWINGALGATQTYTATALNWSNCTQWQTGDPNGSILWPSYLYATYGRALTGNEIGELWADPFCFIRRSR